MDPNLQNPRCRGASGRCSSDTSWPDFFQKLPDLFGDLWRPILLDGIWRYTPPKSNIEPEDAGFEDDFPFPGVYSQVSCSYSRVYQKLVPETNSQTYLKIGQLRPRKEMNHLPTIFRGKLSVSRRVP